MKHVFKFFALFMALFCLSIPCSAALPEKDSFNIFDSGVLIPQIPADDYPDYPYHFIAYYPHGDKYLLLFTPDKLVFKYAKTSRFNYYIDLWDYDFKLLEWYPDRLSWVAGEFIDGGSRPTNWIAWIGYGGCESDYYGSKKILYSNHNIVNVHDSTVFYFKTPSIQSLNYQWCISDLIQFLFRTAVTVVPYALFLVILYILIRIILKLIHLYKKR